MRRHWYHPLSTPSGASTFPSLLHPSIIDYFARMGERQDTNNTSGSHQTVDGVPVEDLNAG